MARTKGSTNITPFEQRTDIESTAAQEIKHLAKLQQKTPLEEFLALLRHHKGYLNWIDTRHQQLRDARNALDPNGKGPKDSTYRKYRWYAEQQGLLECINAFEAFYKRTFVKLGFAIKAFVPAEKVKGAVDGKVLWSLTEQVSAPQLLFEHLLYHDLEQIDKVTHMLVEAKRYNVNLANNPIADRVKCLRATFQVRHTISHNQGHITPNDSSKFQIYGFQSASTEVIDPTKNGFGESTLRLLETEAKEFTAWLLDASASYLQQAHATQGLALPQDVLTQIENSVGRSATLSGLQWE